MFLLTKNGIVETPKFNRFKAIFCRHTDPVVGRSCSKNGLVRISGDDSYVICPRCGKILAESHSTYA